MLKKLCDLFSGLKFTVVSGIFLLSSLILMLSGRTLPVDPAWVTVVISGYPLLYLAITRLVYKKWVSSCLLISIAMLASLAIGELFAAGEVAFIMAIGAILEDMTVNRAKKGLSELMALKPTQGRKLVTRNGKTEELMISAEDIVSGDMLRVKPGEKIPADGVIVCGESSVNQSVMTGESLPVDKKSGDSVFCGTMNCYGSVDIRATGVGEDSSLQKLIYMVQEAENKKAPMQRIADKWSVYLVPIALAIALGAFFINWAGGMELMTALNRGVTVLVVFCPCALALATPTSIMAAIGQAAKKGVIIKSGEALETLGKVGTIAFDKTGTITSGELRVSSVCPVSDKLSEEELLALTASAEAKSEHPLAKAVLSCAGERQLSLSEAEEFHMQAGKGVQCTVGERRLYCGSEEFLREKGIELDARAQLLAGKYREKGMALIITADDSGCLGLIALSDVLRPDAAESIEGLRAMELRSVLLTGDNRRAAEHFAGEAGLDEVRAQLLPQDKVRAVESLKREYGSVCMIGDGVNDAPALKTADVGIAMGVSGSDIAVEAADAVLMQDNLKQLVYLKRLAGSTIKTIKGNITASMCINAAAVTLSVLGLLNPVTGALVHNAGSCLVVLNAALLYDRKFD